MPDAPAMNDLLGADTPKNWGKWGPDDEVGALNYLDAKEVLRGAQHIRTGDVFTLQIQMGRADGPGDPLWPGRRAMEKKMELDESDLGLRRRAPVPRRPALRRRHRADVPAGLHAVRRAGPRLVRRAALERLRRPHHRRRDGQGLRAADRREGHRRPRRADRHGPPPRQGLARQGRDVRPHRPGGRGRRTGRHDRAARHPLRPHGLHEVLVRAQRQGVVLRRLQRAGPHVLARARRVVPAAGGPQPRHRHHRQRGHLRAGVRGRAAAALRPDAQPRRRRSPRSPGSTTSPTPAPRTGGGASSTSRPRSRSSRARARR